MRHMRNADIFVGRDYSEDLGIIRRIVFKWDEDFKLWAKFI